MPFDARIFKLQVDIFYVPFGALGQLQQRKQSEIRVVFEHSAPLYIESDWLANARQVPRFFRACLLPCSLDNLRDLGV